MFIQSQDDSQCCYSFLRWYTLDEVKSLHICGFDIYRNVIVTTIITTNSDRISKYSRKSFSAINSDIQRFRDWPIENNCYYVCMESTEKYWIPNFNYLGNDIDVWFTHLNTSKPSKARRLTKKIPNGLPTSTNLTLSGVPLFP